MEAKGRAQNIQDMKRKAQHPVCRVWQLHAQDFLLNFCVHVDFERDLLFSTLKTKEPNALHTDTPMLCWSARTRSRRELPYSADWIEANTMESNLASCK